jgi:hypothetical protein
MANTKKIQVVEKMPEKPAQTKKIQVAEKVAEKPTQQKTAISGVAKMEPAQKVMVSFDKPNDIVLQLNMDSGVELQWNAHDFRKLPENVVELLRPTNMRNYLVAETQFNANKAKDAGKIEVLTNPMNPLSGYTEARERIRARKGWHQCWAGPGRDYEAKISGPYKQVREPTEAQKRAGYEPGYEDGEVVKLLDGEGKVEAIAMECPQELFDKYLEWMSKKSGARKQEIKGDFFKSVEDINREIPASRKSERIIPLDSEGDVQV